MMFVVKNRLPEKSKTCYCNDKIIFVDVSDMSSVEFFYLAYTIQIAFWNHHRIITYTYDRGEANYRSKKTCRQQKCISNNYVPDLIIVQVYNSSNCPKIRTIFLNFCYKKYPFFFLEKYGIGRGKSWESSLKR